MCFLVLYLYFSLHKRADLEDVEDVEIVSH